MWTGPGSSPCIRNFIREVDVIIQFKQYDSVTRRRIKQIQQLAAKQQVGCYLVGGFVRDALLRIKSTDLDVIVDGDAMALARAFAREHNGKVTVYPDFLTATVSWDQAGSLDFTTARQEIYKKPGALPRVKQGDLRADLFRRDFTVNAMALQLTSSSRGTLIDHYGGMDDLRCGRIRILHDQSFKDDPTRMIRAVRYEQRLGFQMHRSTLQCLNKSVRQGALRTISLDRYITEIKKVGSEFKAPEMIGRMRRLALFHRLVGTAAISKARIHRIQQRYQRLNESARSEAGECWVIYLIELLRNVSTARRQELMKCSILSKGQKQAITQFAKCKLETKVVLKQKKMKPSQVFVLLKDNSSLLVWHAYLSTASAILKDNLESYWNAWNVKLKIDGHDLNRMGLSQGRQVGAMLEQLKMKKMDGEIKSKSDELKLARELIKQELGASNE